MNLDPLIVGRWNGTALWIQFNAGEAPEGFCVEINVRPTVDGEGRWVTLDKGRSRKNWLVVPIWKEGQWVEARVGINGCDGEPEPAREAVFRRPSCVFGFAAGPKPLRYAAGTMFHAQVDSAACGYRLAEDFEIGPGEEGRATMVSILSTGFAQLDYEGHFDLRPGHGVRIWNIGPSENDLEITGRTGTVLARLPLDGPMAMVRKQARNPVVR